ncbi:GNAT family N-acetyltransferase [Actinoallomurus sp. NBC_01490]|uniref:GNAT family N-acetyltransferase n=1 Tax=Actinoallomurus sp. NBC_01490 TaxID=2903557 RepID=UPI002E31191B|nr:GNAT family N-acetyltransferase [Actinoallomurus sp. NBC_01490]
MDAAAVLAAFDEQVRRRPRADDGHVEDDGDVVRTVSAGGGWNGVEWTALTSANADAAIQAQIRRFAEIGRPWEWKHYSYDQPDDLRERLVAAGLTPGEDETLLVGTIAELDLAVRPPAGVELRAVRDRHDLDALVAVHDEVFGGHHASGPLAAALADGTAAAVIAWAGEAPVSAARVEFYPGTEFAGLWGGGTLPAWRGRGVFRSLVAHRAALARQAGYRYLQVDAMPASRPILRRLGFTELATTTPFAHPGR